MNANVLSLNLIYELLNLKIKKIKNLKFNKNANSVLKRTSLLEVKKRQFHSDT